MYQYFSDCRSHISIVLTFCYARLVLFTQSVQRRDTVGTDGALLLYNCYIFLATLDCAGQEVHCVEVSHPGA
jgi:hypothetical protein